jgi:hypothetical protein
MRVLVIAVLALGLAAGASLLLPARPAGGQAPRRLTLEDRLERIEKQLERIEKLLQQAGGKAPAAPAAPAEKIITLPVENATYLFLLNRRSGVLQRVDKRDGETRKLHAGSPGQWEVTPLGKTENATYLFLMNKETGEMLRMDKRDGEVRVLSPGEK